MTNRQEVQETFSYKFGYVVMGLISKLIRFIFIILFNGIFKATKRHKPLIIIYSCSIFLTIIIFILSQKLYTICPILLIILIMGIREYMLEHEERKLRKYFINLFNTIGFESSTEETPYFLYKTTISEYAQSLTFKTMIPRENWVQKKEIIEMYMNADIIDIKQDRENNRKMHIIVKIKSLPVYLEWNDKYIEQNDKLNIGISIYGLVGIDLQKQAHCMIAGETGSGKTNILKCLIYQALVKSYEITLIDFKRAVSFFCFSEYIKSYYEYKDIVQVLKETINETNNRLDKFREIKVDNIVDYNRKSGNNMPRKIIVIDELADIIRTRDKESNILYNSIETLARLARSAGIHLIIGIQRPDSTILSGQIKNNISFRACGYFADREPIRIVLGSKEYFFEKIQGRFMIKSDDFYEVQSFYFSDNDIVLPDVYTLQKSESTPLSQSPPKIEEMKQPISEKIISKSPNIQKNDYSTDFDFSDIKIE